MQIYLKIQPDECSDFFSRYDVLGRLEKKVWNVIQWFVKKFPSAYPRQQLVAEHVGCSRKHVNRTLKKFQEFGWIALIPRGKRRTKIIGMSTSLMAIDISKRKYFKKIEVTSKVTHSSSSREATSSKDAGCLQISKHLHYVKGLSYEEKLKLSLFPEHIYQESLYSSQLKSAKGQKITNEVQYVIGTAIKMAKKRSIPLDWNGYYRTLRSNPYY